MPRSEHPPHMTEDEYLAFEESATVRHEYVAGHVFAMTGSTDAHNHVCGNIFASIHARLKDGPCHVYSNDMKVRIAAANSFYYPDIMVSCESFQPKSVFKEQPVLVLEILSPSTKQIDLREKLVAYQKIDTLREYIIVHQDRQQIDVYRRTNSNKWQFESLGREQTLQLHSLPGDVFSLTFDDIYGEHNPPSIVKEDEENYDFETVEV